MTIIEARSILEEVTDNLSDNRVQEIIDWLNIMADIAIDTINQPIKTENRPFT
jgi:hypothetical protein